MKNLGNIMYNTVYTKFRIVTFVMVQDTKIIIITVADRSKTIHQSLEDVKVILDLVL